MKVVWRARKILSYDTGTVPMSRSPGSRLCDIDIFLVMETASRSYGDHIIRSQPYDGFMGLSIDPIRLLDFVVKSGDILLIDAQRINPQPPRRRDPSFVIEKTQMTLSSLHDPISDQYPLTESFWPHPQGKQMHVSSAVALRMSHKM